MPNIFFTADTHFNHWGILRNCNRPFSDTWAMNDKIIDNWNSVVKPNDIVYHLGDFAWKDHIKFLDRINGKKHLIRGNHDYKINYETRNKFVSISDVKYLNKLNLFLFHYPTKSWPGIRRGIKHLHGHSHGNLHYHPYAYDVGVDCNGFKPVNYEILKSYFNSINQEEVEKIYGRG